MKLRSYSNARHICRHSRSVRCPWIYPPTWYVAVPVNVVAEGYLAAVTVTAMVGSRAGNPDRSWVRRGPKSRKFLVGQRTLSYDENRSVAERAGYQATAAHQCRRLLGPPYKSVRTGYVLGRDPGYANRRISTALA
jgi:hypothetical protein